MQITTIPAKKRMPEAIQKLRVAYYPRVSSKSFEQLLSLNNMIRDAKEEAEENGWELVDIYADEGISGVSVKNRPQLKRLLLDCKAGKIDRVIIKSVSRLGRNVVELMEIVNCLRETGIAIFFDTDKIDTSNGYDPILLSMKALIAENESRSISENMQWSVRRRFESGTYILAKEPYGYYRDGKGTIHIEPYEGKVVKLIYKMALEGHGATKIADYLNEEHYLTRSCKPWCQRSVMYILKNPSYTGDALWQKRYTEPDVFPYHLVDNRGQVPQYVASNIYEQLITKEDFDAVQAIFEYERYKLMKNDDLNKGLNRYIFTGRIKCQCGSSVTRKITHGIVKWVCRQHARDIQSCFVKAVREDDIEQAFIQMRNKLCTNLYLLEELNKELGVYKKVAKTEQQSGENRNVLITLAEESALYNKLYVQNLIDSVFYIQKMQELEMEAQRYHSTDMRVVEEEILSNETRHLIQYLKEIDPIKEWFDPSEFNELVDTIIIIDNETIHFRLTNNLELEEKIEVTI